MGRISNALKGAYYRWRGRIPTPQTVDLGKRDATRRIVGTAVAVVGAAAGATSLGVLLGACSEKAPIGKVKEKSDADKAKKVEIVANDDDINAVKKTRPYGFYLYQYGGIGRCEGDLKVKHYEFAYVGISDPERVKDVKFVKKGIIDKIYTWSSTCGVALKGATFIGNYDEKYGEGLDKGLYFKLPDGTKGWTGRYFTFNLQIEYNDGTKLDVTLKIKTLFWGEERYGCTKPIEIKYTPLKKFKNK